MSDDNNKLLDRVKALEDSVMKLQLSKMDSYLVEEFAKVDCMKSVPHTKLPAKLTLFVDKAGQENE